MFINSRSLSIRQECSATRQSTVLGNMISLPLCVLGLLLAFATLAESKSPVLLRELQETIASNHHRLLGEQQLRSRPQRSGRLLQPSKDREPTLLRGYHPKQTDVALLASLGSRRLNMPKPSSSGGGSSSSGGGSSDGGGGGGDGGGGGNCGGGSHSGKGYLGCLGFQSSELSAAWIFSGSPPVCGYTHHAGYNSFYSSMYAGGYFNGYDYSNVGGGVWAGSSYNGGTGYYSGGGGSDTAEADAGSSTTSSWGGSSYSGGADGYFSSEQDNAEANGNEGGNEQGDASSWGGSSYSGGSGYFTGGNASEAGDANEQVQGGDEYGGYYGGETIDVSGDGVYSSNGYDYSNIRQSYSDADDSQVSLTNANFENVNAGSEDTGEQQGGNQNDGTDGQDEASKEGSVNESSEGEYGSNYQDMYDPYSDFDIEQCDTYENLWLWDLSLTCASENSLYSCRCVYAEELESLGLLSCAHMSLCPSSCPICTTCLQLLGCSASTAGEQTTTEASSTSAGSSGYAYTLGATAGLLVFGASYFVVIKRRQNGSGGDLGAHLMTDQPISGLSFGTGGSKSAGKDHVWLAPATQAASSAPELGPRNLAAEAAADGKTDLDDSSSTYTFDDVGITDQDESVGKSTIATLDDVFEVGATDSEFDKVWLAPVN